MVGENVNKPNSLIISALLCLITASVVAPVFAQSSTVEWSTTFRGNYERTGTYTSQTPLNNQTLWFFSTKNSVEYTSPAVVNGVVYIASHDRYVYALDAATGRMIWSFQTGHSVEASPTVVDNVVYIASKVQNVYAIDAATGNEIWRFPTGFEIYSCPVVVNGVVYIGSNDHHIYALDSKTGARNGAMTPVTLFGHPPHT